MTSPDPGPSTSASPLSLTARTTEDLIALAPVVLGFFPAESVVMLTFGAANAFHARVDLPSDVAEVVEIVDLLVEPARRHRVAQVVLLIYSTDDALSAQLWLGLEEGFARAGIGVVEALRVEDARWFPLNDGAPRESTAGVPFDISSHPFLVRAVVEGRVTHGSRSDLAATLIRDEEAAARMLDLMAEREPALDLLAEGEWVATTIRRGLVEERLPGDDDLARILVALGDLRLRDAAWSVLTREHARAAVGWWTHTLTRCPRVFSAAPAALLAWSAWLHGNGALAWCALDRCEDAAPGYGLARIVSALLEQARPPSSWEGSLDWRAGLDQTSRAG